MTNKEANYLRKLEIENELLRAENAKHLRVYGDQFLELITLKAKLQSLNEVLNEKLK
jgi:hypothetical protein